ncbi:glycosyltransferase family 2 protein [Candidatus Microgenomates bacterium]|nr:glycosyltransferase family 2 protein [Candidatus Microgenomates bacterium]
MSKRLTVSIIILNYNGYELTHEAVESVLTSSYPWFEIIVVDNASTDNSLQLLKKRYNKMGNVKIISSPINKLYTGGFNLGARYAMGDLLLIMNNDVVVEKDSIDKLVKAVVSERTLVQPKILYYSDPSMLDNAGGRYSFSGIGHGKGGGKDTGQYDHQLKCDYVSGTAFMIHKSFFTELGGFDEWFGAYYEDVDLSLRARSRGGECHYCPTSRVYHKISATYKKQLVQENTLFDIRKNRLRTVIKNFDGTERVLRIVALIPVYIGCTITDIMSLNRKRLFLTIRAIIFASSV